MLGRFGSQLAARPVVSTGRAHLESGRENLPYEKLRHCEMHCVSVSDVGGCGSPCQELQYPDRMF